MAIPELNADGLLPNGIFDCTLDDMRKRFGFDVVLVESETPLYDKAVEFFARVRESTELRKGLLRLRL